jgi:hypothetical protein
MNQYEEQKKGAASQTKQEHQFDNSAMEHQNHQDCAHTCHRCGAAINAQMNFCESCGSPVSQSNCFKCGHATSETADICEYCGTWLKTDLCKFCYSPIVPNQTFCVSCGNPYEGITCNKCGTLSYFDFCPSCNNSLTATSSGQKNAMMTDTQYKAYFDILNSTESSFAEIDTIQNQPDNVDTSSSEDLSFSDTHNQSIDIKQTLRQNKELTRKRILEILGKDEETIEKTKLTEAQENAKLHLEKQMLDKQREQQDSWRSSKAQSDADAQMRYKEECKKLNTQDSYSANLLNKETIAENKRKQEAARIQKQEQLANAKRIQNENHQKLDAFISQTTSLKFTNNQEARCYHMNIKPPRAVGWCCNLATVLHPDPMSCAEPALGGRWMLEWNGISDPDKIPWQKNEYGKLICV